MPSFTSPPPSSPPSTPPSTPLSKLKVSKKTDTNAPEKPKSKGSLLEKFHNGITDIQRVGDKSANGFVAKITTIDQLNTIINDFTEEYKEHFILKSVQREDDKSHQKNDNPMYEFEAGLFINTQLLYFPCFLRTYTLFHYGERNRTKDLFMNFLKNVHLMNETAKETKRKTIADDIKTVGVENQTDYTPESCASKNNFALLMDYFDGAVTLDSMLNNNNNDLLLGDEDKAKILFQIYAPLYALGEETFQHKDLHTRNIMVKTFESEVTFTYILNKKTITFKTKYLAKMIDYGRCYIPSTQEYLDEYYSLEPNEKKGFEHMLNHCGIVHVLFGNTDLRLYNMLFPGDKQIRSIEMVLDSLISKIPSPDAQPKGGSTKKTKSNRKKNPKKKTRTRKMKGGDGDNPLIIDCRKYSQTNPSEVSYEVQPLKKQRTSQNSNILPLPPSLPPSLPRQQTSSSEPSLPLPPPPPLPSPRQPTRQQMKYNGKIQYLNDMISTSGDAVKDLYEQILDAASQKSLP